MTHHATQTLQDLGYRLTPQRTLVWDVLRRHGGHMPAEEICQQVQQQFPNINISTVYRTLELLCELRLVRETHLGPNRRFYEVEEEIPHHHLVCQLCGKVVHAHDEDLGDLGPSLTRAHGFTPSSLTVFGTCRDCAALPPRAADSLPPADECTSPTAS